MPLWPTNNYNRGPISQIQPFTYQDDVTYLDILYLLRDYIKDIVVPQLNHLSEEVDAAIDALISEVEAQLAAQNAQISSQLQAQNQHVTDQLAAQDLDVADKIAQMITYVNDAVASIINSSVEVQDPVMAGIISGTSSQSRGILDTLYGPLTNGIHGGYVNAKDYGLKDTNADNSAAIQAAADVARDSNRILYIPSGTYKLTQSVNIYTSVECRGIITIDANSAGRIFIARKNASQVIDPNSVAGLTAGSTKIDGTPKNGNVSIVSNDALITRYGVAQTYTKNEQLRVLNDGSVFMPVEFTYNLAAITAMTFYPREDKRTINNLQISVIGTSGTATRFLYVNGNDIEFNGLRVYNNSSITIDVGVFVGDSDTVTFNEADVRGFNLAGGGYGFLLERTLNTVFNNCNIGACRHPIAGRHNHLVTVNGGVLHGGFDSHWCVGIYLNNVTSYTNVYSGVIDHVLVAGSGDVVVNGGKFYGGRQLVSLRNDTPTLNGTVTVRDAEWWPSAAITGEATNTRAVVGNGLTYDGWVGHNFNMVLSLPDVAITNTKIHATGLDVCLYLIPDMRQDRTHPKNVRFANNQLLDILTSVFYGLRYMDSGTGQPSNCKVIIDGGQHSTVGNMIELQQPAGVGAPVIAWDINISNYPFVGMRFSELVNLKIRIRDSVLKSINRIAGTLATFAGNIIVENCSVDSLFLNGDFVIDFMNNVWSGNATVGGGSPNMDAHVKSLSNNLFLLTSNGTPTQANGYKNATYYK